MFGIDQVKGSKDNERTTLGLQTDRPTDRPSFAKQYASFFKGGIKCVGRQSSQRTTQKAGGGPPPAPLSQTVAAIVYLYKVYSPFVKNFSSLCLQYRNLTHHKCKFSFNIINKKILKLREIKYMYHTLD